MNTIKYSVNTVANPQKRGETIATARVQMNTAVSSAEFVKHISDTGGGTSPDDEEPSCE